MTPASEAAKGLHHSLDALDRILADRLESRGHLANRGDLVSRLVDRPVPPAGGEDRIPKRDELVLDGPLADLVDEHKLDKVETLLVIAALAPLVEEKYAVLYGVLDDTGRATELNVSVARTIGASSIAGRLAVEARLEPGRRLRSHGIVMVEPAPDGRADPGAAVIRLDAHQAAALLGRVPVEPTESPDFPATRLTTVHRFDDLVLAPGAGSRLLHGIARIRAQQTVLEDFGFGRRHDGVAGVTMLFHGPPGTGKTMAAALVAKEVGRSAFAVSLPATVSKYIGETAKNLERVFARAEREHCVLFFDEADAIFGARTTVTDSHDRYANQDVSYLLQRVETFRGVVILATNLLGNIDEAFRRRVDVLVEFTAPGPDERRRIWPNSIPDDMPVAPDVDFDAFAVRYELTGAEIRNAVLEAAYYAADTGGTTSAAMFEDAVRVQLAKAGRAVPNRASG